MLAVGIKGSQGRHKYLVAERRVVRMLLDSHNLHGVVAQTHDSGKHMLTEVLVSRDARLVGRDANMRLVDAQRTLARHVFVLHLVRTVLRCVVENLREHVR